MGHQGGCYYGMDCVLGEPANVLMSTWMKTNNNSVADNVVPQGSWEGGREDHMTTRAVQKGPDLLR